MKKIVSIALVLLLAASLCGTAFAQAQLYYVTDEADILTDEEDMALEELAQKISDRYQCGVFLVIVSDYNDYGYSLDNAADNIYETYALGYGDSMDGILLLLSMADRDYTMLALGYGETAFTSRGLDILSDAFLDDFSRNDWAEGSEQYINTCGELLAKARSGEPVGGRASGGTAGLGVSLILGLVLSGIVCLALRKSMFSVAEKREADAYVPSGGIDMHLREEHYTHSTQTRTKVSSSSSSGSGSGGGGGSRKSGKF